MAPPYAKITDRASTTLVGRFPDEGVIAAALAHSATAAEAVEMLRVAGNLAAANALFAHALPAREAVWWAATCCRLASGSTLDPATQQMIEATEQWVFKGRDDLRRAAYARAQASDFQGASAWAATAAFFAGDSLAPAGQPVVAPAPDLVGRAVHGAVAIAGQAPTPEAIEALAHRFFTSAYDIAAGGSGRETEGGA